MLLHKSEAFNDDNWLTELKLDGIRMIYSTASGVSLYTRHNNDVTSKFPEIITEMPEGIILDGELIQSDKDGKPDFEELMGRFHTRNAQHIKKLAKNKPTTFCAFDILYYQGKNITNLPLLQRKEILQDILAMKRETISLVPYIAGRGKAYFDVVKQKGLEGIVLKKADSKYEIGKRSKCWLKSVVYQYESVLVIGYRKSEFGWLLNYQNGEYAGVLELGVPLESRNAVYELSKSIAVKEQKDYVYFPQPIRCKVKYRNKTKAGLLRLPSFVEFELDELKTHL
jgi:DNA ligase-1